MQPTDATTVPATAPKKQRRWLTAVFLLLPTVVFVVLSAYLISFGSWLDSVTEGKTAMFSRERSDANEAELERKISTGELPVTKEKTVEYLRSSHRALNGNRNVIHDCTRFMRAFGILGFFGVAFQVLVILRVQFKKSAQPQSTRPQE